MHPDHHRRRGMARRIATAVAVLAGMAVAGPASAAVLPATTCSLDVPTNTRTCELYAETGTVNIPPAAQATLSQGTAVSHDAVQYTAVATGPDGNDITIAYTAGSASQSLTVQTVGSAIEVQLATNAGSAPTSTAADIVAAINGDAAASALVIAALPAGDPGTGIPAPVGPTHLAGGAATLPVWAFGETSGGHPTHIGGPTLVAIAGEKLRLVLHNEIPGEEVNLTVPQQATPPMTTKAATGGTVILTINSLTPGTSIYEAGSKTLASGLTAAQQLAAATADDVQVQVAMGLYGALVVRPTGAGGSPDTGLAYGPGTAYADEAVLVLSEVDPALNTSANPSAFDMTSFAPAYRLINGHAYAGDGSISTAPIVAAPGDGVLLRYVNAGVVDHSMALLGLHQTVVGEAGIAGRARDAVAETIPPGETLDAIVHVPAGADGTNYVISDQGQRLDNSSAGWATAAGQPITTGGMLTFISATSSGSPVTCYGPSTSNVHAPDITSGQSDAPVTAHFAPCDGQNVTDAELRIDNAETGTAYPATVVPDGTGWKLDPATVIPQAVLAALSSGNHVVFVRGHGADDKWGSVAADTFFLDAAGPEITGVTVKPATTSGAAGTKIVVTLTADETATGNQNVVSGTATLDGTTVALTTQVPGHAPAPILAMTATFTLAAALTGGPHAITLAATDSFGNTTTPPYSATLNVDLQGPAASGVVIAPNPNNGTLDDSGQPGNVVVHAHLDDPGAISPIARVEGFIDTVGAPGSGFTFVPNDGAFDTASEDVQVWIPLGTINALSEGLHPLSVRGLDAAGNWGAVTSQDIVIDRTSPTVTLAAQPAVPGQPVTLTGPLTDPVVNGANSTIQRLEWFVGTDPGLGGARIDGVTIGAATGTILVPLSALRVGANNTVSYRALDAAGNWSTLKTVSFAVPLPPPTTLFSYPFDGPLTVNFGNPFSATAWSSSTRPARLAIDTAIKAAGASSLRVNIGALGTTPVRTAWLTKRVQTPIDLASVSFAFNPHNALFGAGGTTILEGFNGATGVFRLDVRQNGTPGSPTYQVRAQYRPRLFFAWSPLSQWRTLPAANAFTTLKVSWVDAGGGQNGAFKLTVGATVYTEAGVLAATLPMDSVQVGAIDGVANTASGTFYIDTFVLTTP
jgi:hypothetical protein